MKKGYKVKGVKKEIKTESLEEYRWGIAMKCYEFRKKDYTRRGRGVNGRKTADLIEL